MLNSTKSGLKVSKSGFYLFIAGCRLLALTISKQLKLVID